jgi:hypothetical protein
LSRQSASIVVVFFVILLFAGIAVAMPAKYIWSPSYILWRKGFFPYRGEFSLAMIDDKKIESQMLGIGKSAMKNSLPLVDFNSHPSAIFQSAVRAHLEKYKVNFSSLYIVKDSDWVVAFNTQEKCVSFICMKGM